MLCVLPTMRGRLEVAGLRLADRPRSKCSAALYSYYQVTAFTAPLGLVNPMARIHVRLLGPCFKTGQRGHRPTRHIPVGLRARTPRAATISDNFTRGLRSVPNGSCRKLRGKCTREPSQTKRTVIADQIRPDRPTPRLSSPQKLREPLRLPPHSFTYY